MVSKEPFNGSAIAFDDTVSPILIYVDPKAKMRVITMIDIANDAPKGDGSIPHAPRSRIMFLAKSRSTAAI